MDFFSPQRVEAAAYSDDTQAISSPMSILERISAELATANNVPAPSKRTGASFSNDSASAAVMIGVGGNSSWLSASGPTPFSSSSSTPYGSSSNNNNNNSFFTNSPCSRQLNDGALASYLGDTTRGITSSSSSTAGAASAYVRGGSGASSSAARVHQTIALGSEPSRANISGPSSLSAWKPATPTGCSPSSSSVRFSHQQQQQQQQQQQADVLKAQLGALDKRIQERGDNSNTRRHQNSSSRVSSNIQHQNALSVRISLLESAADAGVGDFGGGGGGGGGPGSMFVLPDSRILPLSMKTQQQQQQHSSQQQGGYSSTTSTPYNGRRNIDISDTPTTNTHPQQPGTTTNKKNKNAGKQSPPSFSSVLPPAPSLLANYIGVPANLSAGPPQTKEEEEIQHQKLLLAQSGVSRLGSSARAGMDAYIISQAYRNGMAAAATTTTTSGNSTTNGGMLSSSLFSSSSAAANVRQSAAEADTEDARALLHYTSLADGGAPRASVPLIHSTGGAAALWPALHGIGATSATSTHANTTNTINNNTIHGKVVNGGRSPTRINTNATDSHHHHLSASGVGFADSFVSSSSSSFSSSYMLAPPPAPIVLEFSPTDRLLALVGTPSLRATRSRVYANQHTRSLLQRETARRRILRFFLRWLLTSLPNVRAKLAARRSRAIMCAFRIQRMIRFFLARRARNIMTNERTKSLGIGARAQEAGHKLLLEEYDRRLQIALLQVESARRFQEEAANRAAVAAAGRDGAQFDAISGVTRTSTSSTGSDGTLRIGPDGGRLSVRSGNNNNNNNGGSSANGGNLFFNSGIANGAGGSAFRRNGTGAAAPIVRPTKLPGFVRLPTTNFFPTDEEVQQQHEQAREAAGGVLDILVSQRLQPPPPPPPPAVHEEGKGAGITTQTSSSGSTQRVTSPLLHANVHSGDNTPSSQVSDIAPLASEKAFAAARPVSAGPSSSATISSSSSSSIPSLAKMLKSKQASLPHGSNKSATSTVHAPHHHPSASSSSSSSGPATISPVSSLESSPNPSPTPSGDSSSAAQHKAAVVQQQQQHVADILNKMPPRPELAIEGPSAAQREATSTLNAHLESVRASLAAAALSSAALANAMARDAGDNIDGGNSSGGGSSSSNKDANNNNAILLDTNSGVSSSSSSSTPNALQPTAAALRATPSSLSSSPVTVGKATRRPVSPTSILAASSAAALATTTFSSAAGRSISSSSPGGGGGGGGSTSYSSSTPSNAALAAAATANRKSAWRIAASNVVAAHVAHADEDHDDDQHHPHHHSLSPPSVAQKAWTDKSSAEISGANSRPLQRHPSRQGEEDNDALKSLIPSTSSTTAVVAHAPEVVNKNIHSRPSATTFIDSVLDDIEREEEAGGTLENRLSRAFGGRA